MTTHQKLYVIRYIRVIVHFSNKLSLYKVLYSVMHLPLVALCTFFTCCYVELVLVCLLTLFTVRPLWLV